MVIELSLIIIKINIHKEETIGLCGKTFGRVKGTVQPQKKGGGVKRGTIDRPSIPTQSPTFFDTLNGLLSCFKFQKNLLQLLQRLGHKTGGIFFYVDCVTKYSKALLLLVAIGGVGELGNCCAVLF